MCVLLALLLVAGVVGTRRLPLDALPDVSTVQVDVLTKAPGAAALDVERTVTFPIENALNGVPGLVELRSVSRFGLSAVTVVFADGTDRWFARQLVLERVRAVQAELPPNVDPPELAPVSTGLGTIYKFVVASDRHSAMQLRTILEWEIVPKLRGVPGVIECNTFGGELKQYQVVVDRVRLDTVDMTLRQVIEALSSANTNVGGGYVERGGESYVLRGQGLLRGVDDIGDVVLKTRDNGTPVLVKHVAEVKVGAALRQGVVTLDGKGEAVSGLVLMLAGQNSYDVVSAVKARIAEIAPTLPPGVRVDVVYDRGRFVGQTLRTVAVNLAEGMAVVTIVLAVLLGSFRGAIAVALGIPASMSIAILGMHAFHVTGDLMSLGAIDFGFLVDGPIVLLEGVIAALAGRALSRADREREYGHAMAGAIKPVAFSVAIIMLVYLPLLTLEGVEGKMFRPMALTMACALFGARVYAIVFVPAVTVMFVPPPSHHAKWLDALSRSVDRVAAATVARRWSVLAGAGALLAVTVFGFSRMGAEFVPRIFEGDAIVAIKRAPSISLDEARRLDLATESILKSYPEALVALGQTGRAELAIDAVGNENTDILVALSPMKQWKTAHDFDDLSEIWKTRIESEVPGTFVSVSQPIEDLTNQLISGSRADVSIKVVGDDIFELVRIADRVGAAVQKIRGTGDLRVERVLGEMMITATADRAKMARYGVKVQDAFDALASTREGIRVGDVYEGSRRFQLRVLNPPSSPTLEGIGSIFVESSKGKAVPLQELVELREGDGPAVVKRQDRERLVRIDVNLRGRDLVSWVAEAKAKVRAEVPLASGYCIEWGGQFENFERASKRLAVVVPAVVAIILGMLFWLFRSVRLSASVFALVPLASVGGVAGLFARGLPFSLPAAVGFIALGGISVLNGVIIASEASRRLLAGESPDAAVQHATSHAVRAVLTTGAVAALGFLPMALSTSAGSEVQRPLATVVVAGILLSSALTIAVFPAILRVALGGWTRPAPRVEEPLVESPVLPD